MTYGPHHSQVADLHLPEAHGPAPVCVVLHGGFWRSSYGLDLATPLCDDLASNGIAALNVEYRRVGDGGGWPHTCLDVAVALDALASAPAGLLDLTRIVALGHSAGGHLVAWLAGRANLPAGAPGAGPRVRLTGMVVQAGVLDLQEAVISHLGAGAVRAFLDPAGTGQLPPMELVSPIRMLPNGIPSVLVHGDNDDVVPVEQSRAYAAEARRAGDDCRVVGLPGSGHFRVITAATSDWTVCREAVQALLT